MENLYGFCKKVHLVIEIDGVTHNGKQDYDQRRENRLKELGLTVLRLDGYYVLKNITDALELILGCIEDREKTPLNPPLIGGQDPSPPLKRGIY